MLSRSHPYITIAALYFLPYGLPASVAQGQAVQLAGDNGKLGVPYTLGGKGEEFVFTLEKAEFDSRVFMFDDAVFAEETQRLLVLTFTVQNPGKEDRFFQGTALKFTVVSPDDKNYVAPSHAYHPETLQTIELSLKPAQKNTGVCIRANPSQRRR